MKTAYLVKYQGGSWDDYYNANVFVTLNEETAKKYIDKANKMLLKWKEYFKKFEDESGWFDDEKHSVDDWYMRWKQIKNISNFYFETITIK